MTRGTNRLSLSNALFLPKVIDVNMEEIQIQELYRVSDYLAGPHQQRHCRAIQTLVKASASSEVDNVCT